MSDGKFCPQCGTQVNQDALFCPKCGYQFAPTDGQETPTATPTREAHREQAAAQPSPTPTPQGPAPQRSHWLTIILGVIAVAVVVVVASNVVINHKEQAHQAALQASESRVQSSKKAKESREEYREAGLAKDAKGVVNDMIQNDDNLDAKCTDVTIESHDGGNQYSGYASVEDDYDDSTTIDITVTDVTYEDNVSVEIPGDQEDKLSETFYSNDD